jgi:hypothetical protein
MHGGEIMKARACATGWSDAVRRREGEMERKIRLMTTSWENGSSSARKAGKEREREEGVGEGEKFVGYGIVPPDARGCQGPVRAL